MAVSWKINREVLNKETELSKVTATRTDSDKAESQSFFYKGRMKTSEEKTAAWINIWIQYQAVKAAKTAVDTIADEGVADLEGRES